MYNPMTHPDNCTPGNMVQNQPSFFRNLARSLTNRLNEMFQSQTQHFILIVIITCFTSNKRKRFR